MSVAKRVLANLRVFSVGQSIGLALDEDDADDDASPEPLALELELASPEAEDVAHHALVDRHGHLVPSVRIRSLYTVRVHFAE